MSSARALIEEATTRGARLYLRGGELRIAFRGEAPADLLDRVRASKPEIVRELAPPEPSLDERRASVEAMLAEMGEENERRRNWDKHPVPGWREGRLEIRSVIDGSTTVIPLRRRRS
jgi:hypothetical protein